MTIPRSVKQWCTKGTGYRGEDNWFTTRQKARQHAAATLLSRAKRVVRIGHMTEDLYNNKKLGFREQFKIVERWELVHGTMPKKVGVR